MNSIRWTATKFEDDLFVDGEPADWDGEATGDLLDVYRAWVGSLLLEVDEPHLGYGWRYAISQPADNLRLADGDGYATANAAKLAAEVAYEALNAAHA